MTSVKLKIVSQSLPCIVIKIMFNLFRTFYVLRLSYS